MTHHEETLAAQCLEEFRSRGWPAWIQEGPGGSQVEALEPAGPAWFIRLRGQNLDPGQRAFREAAIGAGHRYGTVYSLKDLRLLLSISQDALGATGSTIASRAASGSSKAK